MDNFLQCRYHSVQYLKMYSKKDVVASSVTGQGGSGGRTNLSLIRPYPGKPTKILNEREFQNHFFFSNGISVQMVEGGAVSIEKVEDNTMYFTKEQFNARLRFPLPSLFKQFLHYTKIPLVCLHPNVVQVLMGCNILDMLFHLDLSLLEVLFVYTTKKGKNDIFSLFANIPSFQLVMGLPDSIKGGAKGYALVRGPWAGLMEHLTKGFSPNRSLKILDGNYF